MLILLVGASGYIGSALGHALLADGHTVRAAGRDLAYGRRALPTADWVRCDLREMTAPGAWRTLLDDIEIVINASGVLQSGLRDDVGRVQQRAIVALASAAEASGVHRVIQISAAGAATQGTDFMRSKASADAALAASGLHCTVLRPGLVIGRNGFGGTELLREVAGLPLVHVAIDGTGPIQCVAIADVVEAVRRSIADSEDASGSFDLVEADPRSLDEIVALHRRWLGLGEPRFTLRLPVAALKPLSWIADALGWLGWRSPLRSNAIAALVHGVKGDPAQARLRLGREPLSLPETLAGLGPAGKADRWHARLAPAYPLALASLALLWLVSGLIGLSRSSEATAQLIEVGWSQSSARLAVVIGSVADLVIAAGILFRPTLKCALVASLVLAAEYCLGAALVRPDLWLDPLGAMLKVIPIAALTLLCLAMAEER